MNKLSLSETLSAALVLVPGAIGALIVARTLASYWPHDVLASVLVAAMGLVLALGVFELLWRQRRAALLDHEVAALPAAPSEATVDGASALLGPLLRARLEQVPAPGLGDSITPYLTGLLVMLGLLGTLLGLFETVHGASRALTASADVDALRHSLSTPIAGLTRSFGCSAAGISASAMLGLALALVRRREGRALRAVHAYATGPLRVLSPARRQAQALERLTTQLQSPATGAIEQVGAQLGALAAQLTTQQTRASEQVGAQLGALAERLVALQTRTGEQVASQLSAAAQQLVTLQTRSSEQVGGQLSALCQQWTATQARASEQVGSQLGALARELSAHQARSGELLESQLGALSQQLRALQTEGVDASQRAFAGFLSELRGELGRVVTETGEAVRTLQGELSRMALSAGEQLHAQVAPLVQEAVTRTGEIAAQQASAIEARWTALLELTSERDTAHENRWQTLLTQAEQRTRALYDEESARLAKLDGLSVRIGEDLARVTSAFDEQLTRRAERELEHEQRAEAVLSQLGASASTFDASIASQRATIEQLVTSLPALFERTAAASQAGAHAALGELITSTDQRLTQIGEALAREVAQRGELGREQDQRALATVAHIERSAQLIERGFGEQRQAVEELAQQVGRQIGELAGTAREAALSTLARLSDSAEEQAMRWAKLETELADARIEHARGLEEQLAAHADRLESKLGDTSALVGQAAAIWKASSTELSAVADLFASSAERQREASEAWLESLGDIEASVERAGRHAAADALADQLASTQEVFARQLQFQRELFEQLRTLRSNLQVARVDHELEGHDVSV